MNKKQVYELLGYEVIKCNDKTDTERSRLKVQGNDH
jgi:hypothetical protein